MKKATLAAGFLALGALAFMVQPAAATPGTSPKILLHIGPVTTKNACAMATAPTCASAILTGGLYPGNLYFLYVATEDPVVQGMGGVQFGISYSSGATGGALDGIGVDIFGWTLCATLEFQQPEPAWPGSGGGNLITWNGCPMTELTPAGYFYMGSYTADTFRLTPRPVDGAAKTSDCQAVETIIPEGDLGFVAFGGAAGCNPCLADCGTVPVESTTWSSVKSLYTK